LTPGLKQFAIFCEDAGIDATSDDTVAMPADIISASDDDEEEEDCTKARKQLSEPWAPSKTMETTRTESEETATFKVNGPESTVATQLRHTLPIILPDKELRQPVNEMLQLLAWHHQYGHIPMRKLEEMTKQGILPRQLAKCNVPTCSACLFARATKCPWRGKTRRDADNDKAPTTIGEVLLIDQLESPTPGQIAQMTGKLTTERNKYAMVYVDQRSQFGYVILLKTSYAQRQGITIKNYLVDNGIFKANLWVEECKK
jgi:hypothetical protein